MFILAVDNTTEVLPDSNKNEDVIWLPVMVGCAEVKNSVKLLSNSFPKGNLKLNSEYEEDILLPAIERGCKVWSLNEVFSKLPIQYLNSWNEPLKILFGAKGELWVPSPPK